VITVPKRYGRSDGQTRNLITALCEASRGKNRILLKQNILRPVLNCLSVGLLFMKCVSQACYKIAVWLASTARRTRDVFDDVTVVLVRRRSSCSSVRDAGRKWRRGKTGTIPVVTACWWTYPGWTGEAWICRQSQSTGRLSCWKLYWSLPPARILPLYTGKAYFFLTY